jgi:response regulator RpfG family c-di-GMP phosphodiesterase
MCTVCTGSPYVSHPDDVVVCAITAYVDDETYRECMNCGVDKFFSKPFSRASVEMYTRQYESERRGLASDSNDITMVEA